MRGFSSPAAGYVLTCGLVAASLALATLADNKLGAPPPLRGSPLAERAPPEATQPAVPPVAGSNALAAVERAAEPVALTALLLGRHGAADRALVTVGQGPPVAVRPGDTLPGGYRVLAMEPEALTFDDGRQQVRVKLQPGLPAAPVPPATAAPPLPAVPAVAGSNEAFREAVAQRLASLRH